MAESMGSGYSWGRFGPAGTEKGVGLSERNSRGIRQPWNDGPFEGPSSSRPLWGRYLTCSRSVESWGDRSASLDMVYSIDYTKETVLSAAPVTTGGVLSVSRLVRAVKQSIPSERLDVALSDVVTYAFVTTARSSRMGTAMTLTDDAIYRGEQHRAVRSMGTAHDLPLREVLSWTESTQPMERSIAMAALNSTLPLKGPLFAAGNALALAARLGAGKNVVMVGHFPDADEIRGIAARLSILERRPLPGDLPADTAPQVVPDADVVAMTGVTCLNDTIDGLLALKKPGAIFIVLGPTVPLCPVLFDFGIDVVAGAWVEDEELLVSHLAQGGTPRVARGLRYVLMARSTALLDGFPTATPPPERPNGRRISRSGAVTKKWGVS